MYSFGEFYAEPQYRYSIIQVRATVNNIIFTSALSYDNSGCIRFILLDFPYVNGFVLIYLYFIHKMNTAIS